MEYLQFHVYDLTVFNTDNKEVVHFDKLNDVKLICKGSHYEMSVTNAFLHTDYLKFVGKEKVLSDYEKRLGGQKTTISIRNDEGKVCKLIAKSKVYDPDTNLPSDIIIEIPKAVTSLKPSFSGQEGVAYETVAKFTVLANEDVDGGEFFKIHI